jgi:hypothetical protein
VFIHSGNRFWSLVGTFSLIFLRKFGLVTIIMIARLKARTVACRSNKESVNSNTTRCIAVMCVGFVFVGRNLATGHSLVQGAPQYVTSKKMETGGGHDLACL